MPKALVTGATGFVGSHLVSELLKRGYQVSALVRKTSNLSDLVNTGVELVFGDVSDQDSLKKIFFDFDYIFHVAGLIRAKNPDDFFRANAGGTKNLLEVLEESGYPVKRLVLVSSTAAGGPSLNGQPKKETDLCEPVSIYGKSKLEGEKIALEFAHKIPITIIRPPAIYGPKDRQLLNFFKLAKWGVIPLVGKNENYFSVVYVQDLVDAIILAAENPKAEGEIYFIADDEIYNWEKVGAIACGVLGKKPFTITPPKFLLYIAAWFSELAGKITGKPMYLTRRKLQEIHYKYWVCDISKAKTELGFKPQFDFKRGAWETINWYKQNKWL
ncbi:MAG: hypothetical protein A2145_03220 [candidate division Zixibacteria bacterium RBG_16_40_9]|nr:MAG: hypothetical protein A2145_03220 [candidate division Zixibacteria bacterium RBG_16_40_9]